MTDSLTTVPAARPLDHARAPLDPEVLDGGVEGLVLDRAFGDRVRRLVVREGSTILDLLEAAEMPPRRARRCVVKVNGDIEPMEGWETRRLRAGDIVAVAVRPGKGGKSNPLRTILQIIVYAVAIVVGIFYGPGAAALVNAVGSFLINALVPPPKPKQDPKETPTYAIEGAANELRLFGQVPVVMGARRVVLPHAARPYTEIVGNDVHYRMLLTGGVGPAEFSDIRVGETSIEEMDEFSMEIRTGAEGEPPVTLYTNQPRESVVGAILAPAGGWEERETDFDTDEISVDVAFARGLVTYNDEGNRRSRSVTLEIRWTRVEAENWTTVTPTVEQTESTVRSVFGPLFTRIMVASHEQFSAWRAALLGGPPAPSGSWTIKAADAKPVRRNRRWAVPRGKYRVQMRRLTPDSGSDRVSDECQWATLRSIKNEQPSVPPGTPLLALNIRATDRVNGQIEPVSAVVTSVRPKWNGAAFGAPGPTRNPGDLLYAALTGPGNSRPQPLSRIAAASLGQFAELCDARGWTADFVFEDGRSVGEVFRSIAACGRAAFTRIDGRYGVFADVPRITTGQLYTPRNSRGFRAKRRFLPEVHALRIPFPNEEKQHRADERIVYADGYDESNATIFEVLTFDGITNPEKVHEHGRYYLAQLKLRPESYFLWSDIEHAVSGVGDVAYIQHDAILVGLLSARVTMRLTNEGGQVIGVRIDETATMEDGKLYGLRVRRSDTTFDVAVALDAGETRDLTFETPMTTGDAPRAGDLVSFGERGLETIEVIVRRKGRPAKDKSVELEFEPYGHPGIDDATTGVIPAWSSHITDPYRPRPPQPEIIGVVWGEDGIRVEFSIPPSRAPQVAGFSVRWRETPDDDADGEWERLPQLAAGERLLVTPAPPVGASTDIEIVAFDAKGERGPAARELGIESEETVPAPTILSVTGISKTGPGGASTPAVAIVYAPALETRLNRLAVQLGPEDAGEGDWVSAGSLDPKAGQGEVAAGLPPGGVIDARFRLESRRGAFSDPWVEVRGIVMPGLVASDSVLLGGRPADIVIDELDGVIAAASANAGAIAAEIIARAAADGALQTLVDSMEVDATGALNQNPVFRNWPVAGGLPTGWSDSQTGGSRARVAGFAGLSPYAIQLATGGGVNRAIAQNITINPGWYVVEADIVFTSGALTGAGVYIDGAGSKILFDSTPDQNGNVLGATPATGRRYRWRVLYQHTDATTARYILGGTHATFGSVAAARDLALENLRIRPAQAGEIEAGIARGASASLSARIASEATIAATATAAVATRASALEATAASPTALRDRPAVRVDFSNSNAGLTPVNQVTSTLGTVVNVANEGDVIESTGAANGWWSRGWLPVISGRTYRWTCRNRATVDGTGNVTRAGYALYTSTGALLTTVLAAEYARLAVAGWVNDSFEVTAATILASYPTAAFIRPFVRLSVRPDSTYSGSTMQMSILRLEDITDLKILQAAISTVETAYIAADSALANSVTTVRARLEKKVLPSCFDDEKLFSNYFYDNLLTGTPVDSNVGTFPSVAGVGKVWRTRSGATGEAINHKGFLPLIAGHTYKYRARFRAIADATNGNPLYRLFQIYCYDATGAGFAGTSYYNLAGSFSTYTVANGWIEITTVFTAAEVLAAVPNTAFIRALWSKWSPSGASDGQAELQVHELRDITDEQAIQAQVTVNAGAIADINGGTAWLEQVVAAAGGDLAAFRMRAGKAGSFIDLVGTILRFVNVTNGTMVKAMELIAGNVFIANSLFLGASMKLDPTIPGIIITTGSARCVLGVGFGASSDLVMWFGPSSIAVASMTTANATFCLTTAGGGRFKDTLLVGALTNTGQTTALANNASVVVGPFGTGGGHKSVTLSYMAEWDREIASGGVPDSWAVSATVVLERSIDNGATWTQVGSTLNASGTVDKSPNPAPDPGYLFGGMSSAFTVTDTNPSGANFMYRGRITGRTDPGSWGNPDSQRVSVASVE